MAFIKLHNSFKKNPLGIYCQLASLSDFYLTKQTRVGNPERRAYIPFENNYGKRS